jgi:hypothetical protein
MRQVPKHRRIRVVAPAGAEWKNRVRGALLNRPGVSRIDTHEDGTVELRYDLMKIRLERIEEVIESLGYPLRQGSWSRLRRRFIHYTEQNERENITAPEAPCCFDPKLHR